MLFHNKKAKGFTLTEVLLAVAVVGIIAALVLPSTISKFDSSILENGFKRQEQAIQTAIDVLPIKENATNFGETSMYSDGSKTAEESSGKFIKRYLRVSKYFGDAVINKDAIKKECFAQKYYEYSGGEKKELDIDTMLFGACAKLKNGASLCLAPQIGTTNNIQGVMDLNGPKGPNIIGRDMRSIVLNQVTFSNYSTKVSDDVSTDVYTTDNPNLNPDKPEPCEEGNYTTACCNYFQSMGRITNSSHGCCSNPAVSASIPQCASNITIDLNFYSSGNSTASCVLTSSTCKPTLKGSGTNAKLNNTGSPLTKLPSAPPRVDLYCGGVKVGNMVPGQLKQALEKTSGTYEFKITNKNSGKSCQHQSGSGIKPTKSSMVFENGQSTIYKDGVNWTVKYH